MLTYFKGLNDCIQGLTLIFKPGIRKFVVLPLMVNIILFASAIYFLSEQMRGWIQSLLPGWLMWLEWLIWPVFALTIFLIVFYSFALLANLIAAPFNSILAARIETHLKGGVIADYDTEALWKIAVRSFASELRKLVYFIVWLIPLLILTVTPVINVISPVAWFLYAAWSFSLEYTDYPLANHGKYFDDIKKYNRNNRMRSLGFGTGVFLMTSIPFINFLAMPVAVAGATHLTSDENNYNG